MIFLLLSSGTVNLPVFRICWTRLTDQDGQVGLIKKNNQIRVCLLVARRSKYEGWGHWCWGCWVPSRKISGLSLSIEWVWQQWLLLTYTSNDLCVQSKPIDCCQGLLVTGWEDFCTSERKWLVCIAKQLKRKNEKMHLQLVSRHRANTHFSYFVYVIIRHDTLFIRVVLPGL